MNIIKQYTTALTRYNEGANIADISREIGRPYAIVWGWINKKNTPHGINKVYAFNLRKKILGDKI